MMTMMLKEKYEIFPVFIAFFAIMELTTNLITFAHREHKVHNIVLYPDKHSWCKTLAIKQVISYPGCKSEEIDNNVCVGTCFSYSIPHTEPSDPGEVIVPYCDSCQPSDTTWHHVTLECTKNSIDTPPQLVKRVQIINNCSCTSCEKSLLSQIHSTNQYNDEDDNDLIMSHVHHHDVPDVLKILNRSNTIMNDNIVDGINGIGGNFNNPDNNVSLNNTSTIDKFKDIKQILNHKIITLLKNIQENNSVHDKEQLMDLLRMIQGPNSKLNDKNIEDFVNSLHSENIELDIPRLREILIKFEHSKYYEKHRKYFDKIHDHHLHHNTNNNDGNGENDNNNNNNNNNNNENDNMNQSNSMHTIHHLHSHHQHHHHYDGGLTESFENNEQQHAENLHHHEQNEHDRGNDQQQQEQKLHSSIHHGTSHHHYQHHIGENIIGHGHLTRGPHGALVIEPEDHHHVIGSGISDVGNVRNNNNENNKNNNENVDNNDDGDDRDDIDDDSDDDLEDIENNNNHHPHHPQHEKLDVNPHELKPNHAGTLLSYSGHSSSVDNSRNP